MGTRANYSGLVIAGIGFFLTRFTVTLAVYEDPIRFYLAGVVPLALGLGLAAVGIALVVADVDPDLVRTTATWCVIGAVAMLILVVLTLLGSMAGGMPDLQTVQSRTYLSNFLIGGSVGGAFTGLYAARNRRNRAELRRQARRLEILNRLLRHEVLNAVAVIRGYVSLQQPMNSDAVEMIERRSDTIEQTINEVKYLTQHQVESTDSRQAVDLGVCLASSVATIRERYPDASVSVESVTEGLHVRANDRLERVFTHLTENAVIHSPGNDASVDIGISVANRSVRVHVDDRGPGLPENQRALLEDGEIEEFDDPDTGFGLNIVRLLVESYGGSIETAVDGSGTRITVELARGGDAHRIDPAGIAGSSPSIPHLTVTMAAALIAGVAYGVAAEFLGGSISVIGVFYGIDHAVIGWLTHEFHSVVFGFVFAGLVSLTPTRYGDSLPVYVAIGLGWSIVLWFVAAGIISPIWLQLIGIPATVPSLSGMLLVTHLVWGITLAVLCALGYRHVTPRLKRGTSRRSRGRTSR